ncbi:MAG TPA: hypothetical protein DHN33_09885 [Eubacteriaceae bacterium]|nr:hypothetical protein [Eubacteriaceae bacterium]
MKRPKGITIIGYYYMFGAIVLLFTLGVEQDININVRVGLAFLPELKVKILISLLWIVMSYGYLKMKRWGYWLMIIYSIYVTVINGSLALSIQNYILTGNIVFSLIVIVYTFNERLSFYSKSTEFGS